MSSSESLNVAALIAGAFTMVLLGCAPYISEWMEPNPSIGQQIGEAARDMVKGFSGLGEESKGLSKGEQARITMTVLGLVFLAIAAIVSSISLQRFGKSPQAIAGLSMAGVGLLLYFFHLAVGFIALLILFAFVASLFGGF
ncbi:MAG: hypothetical protein AAFV80_08200 [Bacteroidota bacterium]